MNTLSWLIYAAELLDNLSIAAGVVFFTFPLAYLVRHVAAFISTDFSPKNVKDAALAKARQMPKPLVAIWFIAMAVCVFVPGSKTLWLIAASEAGETVVTSPDAIEMMGDLKAIIKKRLKDELSAD